MPTRMSKVRTHLSHPNGVDKQGDSAVALDPEEAADRLLRDLRSAAEGFSTREAQRRLLQYGPNTLQRRRKRRWPPSWRASSPIHWPCCFGWRQDCC